MIEFVQVLVAVGSKEEAEKISQRVVEERLAGCAQILGPIASTYWWQGKIEKAKEWLCLMKSRGDLYQELETAIRRLHSYDVPEIVATPIVSGSKEYFVWLESELKE